MLKIKDNVDLKELEKFGFKLGFYYYGYKYAEKHLVSDENTFLILFVDEKDRTFTLSNGKKGTWFEDGDIFDLDTFYDLIKADLVEKVGE